MDFHLAERFVKERFQLKDRVNPSRIVPFIPNPAQHRLFGLCQRLVDEGRPLRVISVKGRRVGFSRAVEAIGCCYMFAYPNFEGRLMAHYDETAADILSSAALMVFGNGSKKKGIYWSGKREVWDSTKDYKAVIVPHAEQKGLASSRLVRASAKVRGKGRGLGYSFYHGSEAAFYPEDSPFSSILPTLAKDLKASFAAIESTGNGQVGDGKAFYDYWENASEIDKPNDSDWVKFFIPWTEDPNAWSAQVPKDIPRDDEEKVLVKMGLTVGQIAWRRHEIATQYEGITEKFMVENPLEPNDSFIASGFPAFSYEEHQYVNSTVRPPRLTAELENTREPFVVKLASMGGRGRVKIWEMPMPRMEYYIGVDAARGEDSTNRPGDFAAITVWNGSTGEQAASFCERVDPSKIAEVVNKLGRFYRTPEISPTHVAMLNIEVNANLGAECQRLLRDRYAYPVWRFARWRGSKDDRYNRKTGTAIGWETTGTSRNLMFAAFRTSLRERAVCVRDEELAGQICAAKMEDGRWEIMHGHDDVLVSGLLGWISRQQFPPQTIQPRKEQPDRPHPLAQFEGAMFPLVDELARTEDKEMQRIMDPRKRNADRDPLYGVLTKGLLE